MAEIKSTIDLIMERTKNLSASPEEKEAWQRREREKHFRSLVQRLMDYSLTLDDVKAELERERKSGRGAEALGHLKNALADHVDPDSDNERLFRIVNELAGTPEALLREALRSCRAALLEKRTSLAGRQREALQSAGIAGSAVVPNPEADPEWKALEETLQEACTKRFRGIISS